MEAKISNMSEDVELAYKRIKAYIYKTPLMFSKELSDSTGASVYLKLECEQLTGCFKVRGALNKMFLLKETEPEKLSKGIVTASSGNHGIGCLYGGKLIGHPVEVYGPESMSQSKIDKMSSVYGAKIVLYGKDCMEAEGKGRQTALERDQLYIPPYNDWDVITGSATVGYEIYAEQPEVDCVLASVGGGGLISGLAAYLKSKNSKIQVIGCQPRNSKVMFESVKVGYINSNKPSYDTISDGTAGGVEKGSVTFPVCARLVDDWILVDEHQISDAIFSMLDIHHKVIEGAAGVALAALQSQKERFKGKNVAVVLCGGNVTPAILKTVLDSHVHI